MTYSSIASCKKYLVLSKIFFRQNIKKVGIDTPKSSLIRKELNIYSNAIKQILMNMKLKNKHIEMELFVLLLQIVLLLQCLAFLMDILEFSTMVDSHPILIFLTKEKLYWYLCGLIMTNMMLFFKRIAIASLKRDVNFYDISSFCYSSQQQKSLSFFFAHAKI